MERGCVRLEYGVLRERGRTVDRKGLSKGRDGGGRNRRIADDPCARKGRGRRIFNMVEPCGRSRYMFFKSNQNKPPAGRR